MRWIERPAQNPVIAKGLDGEGVRVRVVRARKCLRKALQAW